MSRGGSSRGSVSRVPSRSGRSAGGGGGKSGGR